MRVSNRTDGIAGVILAGGRARRMGGVDKALVSLAGRPMIAHVLGRLTPQVAAVAINANGEPSRFAEFGCATIADASDDFAGPLAGVLAGLRWAASLPQRPTHLVTVAVDLPLLPEDFVERLADAQTMGASGIAVARSAGGSQPVCALVPLALTEDLAAALADGCRKVRDWQHRHRVDFVDFPPIDAAGCSIDPFINVNSPDDLAFAEAILKRLGR